MADDIPGTGGFKPLDLDNLFESMQANYQAWVAGFEFLQMLRLRAQLDGSSVGDNPNRIAVDTLNDIDRRILKESLRVMRSLQQRLKLDYER